MDHYIVSARKYRPSTFESVVGQEALTHTLRKAIATDRLAHAYLFCGSRGVGKTSCARIFAKSINCTNRTPEGEACNECESCRQFNENRSLNIIELDAASNNGIDDIRDLTEQVMVPPTLGRYRVFIIDEVHMLSTAAFNAFLKTLEEPPAHAIFILATTEKHKIIPTILSRCQIYDFNRITVADMVAHLRKVAAGEGIKSQDSALQLIASKADGAMRDALSIFDQVAAASGGEITYESAARNLNVLDDSYYQRLVDAFAARDVAAALLIYKEVRDKGFDSQFFINGLGAYLRNLMVACHPSTIVLLEATDEAREAMARRASLLEPTYLYKAMDLCNEADFNYRAASNKQLLIELTLIKLCQRLSPSTKRSGHVEGHLEALPAIDTPAVQGVSVSAAAPSSAPAARRAATPAATVHPGARAGYSPRPKPTAAGAAEPQASRKEEEKVRVTPEASPEAATDGPVSEKFIAEIWREYAAANPTRHLLVSAMNSATLAPGKTPEAWTVVASNAIAGQYITDALPAILNFMRAKAGLPSLSLEVVTNQEPDSPRNWDDGRLVEHWRESRPQVRAFIDKYKLRLI